MGASLYDTRSNILLTKGASAAGDPPAMQGLAAGKMRGGRIGTSNPWLAGARRETVAARRRQRGVGLRLAYRVAEVCNADARDDTRVAKSDWRTGEAVEEANSGAKKDRGDVDAEFVEEPGIQ